ncbi:MAG: GTPase Era, partial [Pseudoalteromonas sp.]
KDRDLVLPHMKWLGDKFDFIGIMPVSATQGKNLSLIKDEVTKRLPLCEFYFPEDYVTDRSMRFMAAEVIREKLMRFMGEELPYSVTVEIEQFKWQDNGVWRINGLILVERETQKRMVIGNKGEKLKVIGREARKDLEEMLDNKVFLELWVKVKSGWADDERALRSLGYGED